MNKMRKRERHWIAEMKRIKITKKRFDIKGKIFREKLYRELNKIFEVAD
jgi:hypothetical protein